MHPLHWMVGKYVKYRDKRRIFITQNLKNNLYKTTQLRQLELRELPIINHSITHNFSEVMTASCTSFVRISGFETRFISGQQKISTTLY